jgi:hypothetical protein
MFPNHLSWMPVDRLFEELASLNFCSHTHAWKHGDACNALYKATADVQWRTSEIPERAGITAHIQELPVP